MTESEMFNISTVTLWHYTQKMQDLSKIRKQILRDFALPTRAKDFQLILILIWGEGLIKKL